MKNLSYGSKQQPIRDTNIAMSSRKDVRIYIHLLMFDVYNNTAPRNISHLFTSTQQIHSYSTRSSSSGNYYISHSRLNQKNDSFSIRGAKIWNSIPENLRNSSKSLFKEKVHAILLKIFEAQDSYADLNTTIKKILAPAYPNSCLDSLISIFSRD